MTSRSRLKQSARNYSPNNGCISFFSSSQAFLSEIELVAWKYETNQDCFGCGRGRGGKKH